MVTELLIEHDDTPHEDKIVVLRRATWADYQRLLELRGEAARPRLAYLEGELEIITPSSAHVLGAGVYDEVLESQVLAGIDLLELASYLDRSTTSQAIREYRAASRARGA